MYINLHHSMDYNVNGTVFKSKAHRVPSPGENDSSPTYIEHDFGQLDALLLPLDLYILKGYK